MELLLKIKNYKQKVKQDKVKLLIFVGHLLSQTQKRKDVANEIKFIKYETIHKYQVFYC